MPRLRPLLLLIGFTATVAQIVLMRELLVVFYGNEISLGLFLASWLFWTGTGSSLFGRGWKRAGDPRKVMSGLQVLVALTLPLTIGAVRSAKGVFISVPGEMLGPWPMLLTALVVLGPICVLSGGMFSAGSRLLAQETEAATARATGSLYLLEAIGSGVGGGLVSVVLVRHFTSVQVALGVGLLNLLAAASLLLRRPVRRWAAFGIVVVIFAAWLFPLGAPWMERISLERLWRGFHLLTSQNSAYGNLAVVETEASRTLLENGLALFTVPDPQSAEESVHFALLQHPEPRRVLLIGGALNGSVTEALKHPSIKRIDVVELDPKVFELGRSFFGSQMSALEHEPRVVLHIMDGRLFLKTTANRYDVIILNLPEPQTAQINRFYTVEFFEEAAAKLQDRGMFSFQLPASENYITPTRASFLRSIDRSLRDVFPDVSTIPGDTVHFFAAKLQGTLSERADDLLERLKARQIETQYVREYYLPFRMAPDRMAEMQEQLRPASDTAVNRDFVPIAYYFDVALWSTQFNERYREIFAGLARVRFGWLLVAVAVLPALGMIVPRWTRHVGLAQSCVAGCTGAMGFTVMALEVLLLLGFQAIYGFVYQQLALLVAAVMMGMALGSWLGLRRIGREGPVRLGELAGIQVAAALSPLLLYGTFAACTSIRHPSQLFLAAHVLFPLIAVLCGLPGGYQFPLASRLYFEGQTGRLANAGVLYAVDLFGACLGAVLLSAYFVPVFGFLKTGTLLLALNVAVGLVAITAALREKWHPA